MCRKGLTRHFISKASVTRTFTDSLQKKNVTLETGNAAELWLKYLLVICGSHANEKEQRVKCVMRTKAG